MSIKQNGGVFGRNPTFNDVTIDGAVNMASTLTVAGKITANGGIALADNDKATFGTGNDLEIYHDASNSYITDVGTGNLKIGGANVEITTAGGTLYFQGAANVAKLFHTGNQKLATTSSGIDVTGNVSIGSGNLVIGTSGKGIDFSATAGAGTSELFDDYEEGTFTPQLQFGGANAGMAGSFVGRYTKTGRVVYYTAVISLSAKGSSTGNTTISGFPYTSSSSAALYEGKMDTDKVTGMAYQFVAQMPTNATTLNVYVNVGGTLNNVGDGGYANDSRLYVTGFYEV
tara:strand:- start:5693 stop:6550 length:858 start_codon:yes stop_codon:yes gene_type:complete